MLIKMKSLPLISFLLIILAAATVSKGQNNEFPLMVDVKFWKTEGDTLAAKALYINQYNFQFGFNTCDSSGNSLTYYTPKDLAGFFYKTGDEIVEFNSLENPEDMGRLFLRVLHRGRLILYQFLEINHAAPTLTYQAAYYLWNNGWLDPPITQKFEKESLMSHFSECPELEYKIKTGVYGLPQIRNIITEFESCLLTDTYEFFYE